MRKIMLTCIILFACFIVSTSLYGQETGDVNADGAVNIVDALMISQYYVGLNPSGFNTTHADVNVDGQIDIIDALMVAHYYVGLILGFP